MPWIVTIEYTLGKSKTMADALSIQEWRMTADGGDRPDQRATAGAGGDEPLDGAGVALRSLSGAGGCEGPALTVVEEDKEETEKTPKSIIQ